DGMLSFLQHIVSQGFLRSNHAALLLHESDPEALVHAMLHYVPSLEPKWLDPVKARELLP
ncbi:MAG: TIGR00730 family Rossman fold protein, partial [Janthinobacterium lividum]